VTKRFQPLSLIAIGATVFAMISWGSLLQAQQTDTQQPSQTQSQQSQQPQSQQPSEKQSQEQQQAPNTQQRQTDPNQPQASDSSGASEFIGTVVKQGNKYMFQDSASGQTYDIDHQEEVKKFEGKKVRVHGTLDENTKTIHVQ
jgi:hypothetical protein